MEKYAITVEWLTAIVLFGAVVGALEVAFLFGRRAGKQRSEIPDQLATIQGAMLGLLALLLGFSFAIAAGRFSDRANLIVQEANAIGTAWLRCDMMPDAQRTETRQLMRLYVAQRVAAYDAEPASREISLQKAEELQGQIWRTVSSAAKASPEYALVLLPSFNELIDQYGTRVAAGRRHLPLVLFLLLLTCSVVSAATVGYGCGIAGKRNVLLTTAFSFLIASALWAIVDLDHPNRGLIRVGQQPMLDLQKSFERDSTHSKN